MGYSLAGTVALPEAAPIDVLQLKRELQGCRNDVVHGHLGAWCISLGNETWGRETLTAPVVLCRVLRP